MGAAVLERTRRRRRPGRVSAAVLGVQMLGRPYRSNPRSSSARLAITAVTYVDNCPKFRTSENPVRGTRVCVTGKISDYQGKPEIVLPQLTATDMMSTEINPIPRRGGRLSRPLVNHNGLSRCPTAAIRSSGTTAASLRSASG